jgi:hypothetical protein
MTKKLAKQKKADSANIIPFPEPDYFGDCPKCYRNDGCYNYHMDHWYVCHKHKVRWLIGGNLFSSWKRETHEDWFRNWQLIGNYKVIKSLNRWKPDPEFTADVNDDDISDVNDDIPF